MLSRRIPAPLMERFKHYCEHHVPRVTDTAILEAALEEYLDRHEPKAKKSAEK